MVGGFKGAVSMKLGYAIWQKSFHDHIIHNEKDCLRIAEYIDNNPAKWTEDRYFRRSGTLPPDFQRSD